MHLSTSGDVTKNMRTDRITTVLGRFLAVATVFVIMLHDAGAETTYHIALPGMPSPTPINKVAYLHVSGTTITTTPNISTPSTTCTPTSTGISSLLDNTCADLLPNEVGISQKGIVVSHDSDFRLHVLPMSSDGLTWGDGYLAIPDKHLGTEYYVITYCTLGGTCQFSVVGTADGTSVMIEFPGQLTTTTACVNGQTVVNSGTATPFTLNDMDVLLIESEQDLSGTYITASAKIAVFSGVRGLAYAGADNGQIFEQLLPTNKYGSQLVIMPNDRNPAGDLIKIISKTDNTKVEITGISPIILPQKGKALEKRIDWRMYSRIKSSSPIMVLQIMSIDLYNDTANVGGPLGMVLLQSTDRWTTDSTFVCSDVETGVTYSLLTAVGNGGQPVFSPAYSTILHQSEIMGTTMKVFAFEENALVVTSNAASGSVQFGYYGYCIYGSNASASAMLLAHNLDEDSTDCMPSLSTPGDDIDNDCNEQTDELTCTQAELSQNFTSVELTAGDSNSWWRAVGLPGYVKFEAETCDVAEVLLWCSTDPETHAAFQISPSHMNLHVRSGGANATIGESPCGQPTPFWLQWERTTTDVIITAGDGNTMTTEKVKVTTEHDCFDRLTLHAMSGTASFELETAKDCAKIISDTADNHGIEFVIPVSNTDMDYSLYITGLAGTVTVHSPGNDATPVSKTLASNSAVLTKSDVTIGPYTHLLLTADAEVSVYLIMTSGPSGSPFGLHLYPTDILGPAYLSANLSFSGNHECKLFSIDRQIDVTVDDADDVVKEFESNTFTDKSFMNARQVMPVFCGDFTVSAVQIPPRETLGKQFYIPAIPFWTAPVNLIKATLTLVTTYDSTYVKILGDYDQEDIIDLQVYDPHTRSISTDQIFTIDSNKPVQVFVEFMFIDGNFTTVIIPPVTQYKNTTKFPALGGSLRISYCIDNTGGDTSCGSQTPTDGAELTFPKPTFFIAFYEKDARTYAILSDFGLADVNEVCIISNTGDGDGKDDDCDGLIDEDVCQVDIVVGTIDSDIDGSINEDCTVDTIGAYTVASFSLLINATHVACGASGSTSGTVTTVVTGLPPTTPMPVTQTWDAAPNVPIRSTPTFVPIDTMSNASATITTFDTTNSTTADNVTVTQFCDAVCPCGWVNPPNMTEAELITKVEQIQEKLRIKKTELSAFLRKKTSAQDNRPSATAVGSAGVTFLVITLTAVVLLDLASLVRDLRLLRENLRQAFEM